MTIMGDTGQQYLPVGTTLLYSFYAFMAPAALLGLLGGPVGLMVALTWGGVLGVPVALVATAVWSVIRRITGETALPCLAFGALCGMTFLFLGSLKMAVSAAVIVGALFGSGAGLVYWLLAEKYKTRRAARAARAARR